MVLQVFNEMLTLLITISETESISSANNSQLLTGISMSQLHKIFRTPNTIITQRNEMQRLLKEGRTYQGLWRTFTTFGTGRHKLCGKACYPDRGWSFKDCPNYYRIATHFISSVVWDTKKQNLICRKKQAPSRYVTFNFVQLQGFCCSKRWGTMRLMLYFESLVKFETTIYMQNHIPINTFLWIFPLLMYFFDGR